MRWPRHCRTISPVSEKWMPTFVPSIFSSTISDSSAMNAFDSSSPRCLSSTVPLLRSKADECLKRNQRRTERVPDIGVLSTATKLELPTLAEGFDTLRYVRLTDDGFAVEEWNDEI